MKKYTFEEVAPFVISRQVVEEEIPIHWTLHDGTQVTDFAKPVYWTLPNGTQVTDFTRCVYDWVNFLNDNIREVERGY